MTARHRFRPFGRNTLTPQFEHMWQKSVEPLNGTCECGGVVSELELGALCFRPRSWQSETVCATQAHRNNQPRTAGTTLFPVHICVLSFVHHAHEGYAECDRHLCLCVCAHACMSMHTDRRGKRRRSQRDRNLRRLRDQL